MKGIEDEYAKKMIIDYLSKFKSASRADIENMLLSKLPDILDYQQKKDKVKNFLTSAVFPNFLNSENI